MVAIWKVKKFFGLNYDLVEAFGEVLEKHNTDCEPIEVLPASKEKLKEAILVEALSVRALKDPNYMQALMVSFLSLAHFQKGLPKGGLQFTERLAAASKKTGDDLVEAVIEMGPTLGARNALSDFVNNERQQLGEVWQKEFERFAKAYESHLAGESHASR